MKIKIKARKLFLFLWIPEFIIGERISNSLFKIIFKDEQGYQEIKEHIPYLLKEFKKFARKNRGFVLVDIISKDNEKIKIIL